MNWIDYLKNQRNKVNKNNYIKVFNETLQYLENNDDGVECDLTEAFNAPGVRNYNDAKYIFNDDYTIKNNMKDNEAGWCFDDTVGDSVMVSVNQNTFNKIEKQIKNADKSKLYMVPFNEEFGDTNPPYSFDKANYGNVLDSFDIAIDYCKDNI